MGEIKDYIDKVYEKNEHDAISTNKKSVETIKARFAERANEIKTALR